MRFTTDNSDLARVRFLQQTAFHRFAALVHRSRYLFSAGATIAAFATGSSLRSSVCTNRIHSAVVRHFQVLALPITTIVNQIRTLPREG